MSESAPNDASADGRSLDAYASAIRLAFFDLPNVEPVTLLGEGWDSVAVETAGGVVFRFPKREATAGTQAKERLLLPFLRGHLSAEIPAPQWESGPQGEFRWGFTGYEKIQGVGLRAEAIREENVEHLARSIGEFLFELHQFSAERARSFEVPGMREWRAGFETLSRAALRPLKRELRIGEFATVRRWWRDFLANERNWDFEPALVHGDLSAEHLLVDEEARWLVGVIDWGDAAVGDAAIDFVGLMQAYGTDFAWRVVEAYRERGGRADAGLLSRIRRLNAVVPFHAVRFAQEHGGDGGVGPSMAEAVAALRAGPILSR